MPVHPLYRLPVAVALLSALPLCLAGSARAEPECRFEDALSRAAAQLLEAGTRPDPLALRQALTEAGSDAVGVHALYLPADAAMSERAAWLSRIATSVGAPLACGEAQGERGALWLAAGRAGGVSVERGEPERVTGWLSPGYSRPVLVLIEADGALSRTPVSISALAQGVPLGPEVQRPARLQLVATGASGPRPVAERLLPPRAHDVTGDANGVLDDLAHEPETGTVSGRVNSLRRQRGVGEVRRHQLLRALAAQHANQVCLTGRVAHRLEPGGDPESRLRAAGIEAGRVGEAVARAPEPAGAFAALLRSPSHLMTLVEPGFTDGGVGVARDGQGHACVVVLLARWPRYVGH